MQCFGCENLMCEACRDTRTDDLTWGIEAARFEKQYEGPAEDADKTKQELLLFRRQRTATDLVCVKIKRRLAELYRPAVEKSSEPAGPKEDSAVVSVSGREPEPEDAAEPQEAGEATPRGSEDEFFQACRTLVKVFKPTSGGDGADRVSPVADGAGAQRHRI